MLDNMKNPNAVTLEELITASAGDPIGEWLAERKNRRAIPHRMERCGYVSVRNPAVDDGRWRLRGRRQVVYARASLSLREQINAARGLQHEQD